MKNLVVIPTYNEKENIKSFIETILGKSEDFDVLVVDDSSPDGTGEIVEKISQENARVNLLTRLKKEGLGRAYVAGFSWGLEKGYENFFEMDADFSHRPDDLPALLSAIEEADFVIGSRNIPGGATENWPISRQLISKGGSFYTRCVLGREIYDWTGGFNGYRRSVLEKVDLNNVSADGFFFQIELKYRALKSGFKVKEVPILFVDRTAGTSKMSTKIFAEGLVKVWSLRLKA